MGWWIALLIGALAFGQGHLLNGGLLFAGVAFVLYWISLQRHPFRTCRACGGTGRRHGAMFWWSHRACTACGGSPRHRRWGVQLFHNNPASKQTWAERNTKQAGKTPGTTAARHTDAAT